MSDWRTQLREFTRTPRMEWLILAVGAALGLAGFFWRGSPPRVGDTTRLELTLVPEDKRRLACASDVEWGQSACAFLASGAKRESAVHRAVPVVSTSGTVYLLSELFEDVAVTEHLETARKGKRFTLSCTITLDERLESVAIRFEPSAPFTQSKKTWRASVKRCVVRD